MAETPNKSDINEKVEQWWPNTTLFCFPLVDLELVIIRKNSI